MKNIAAKTLLLLTLTPSFTWAVPMPRQSCPKAPLVTGLEAKTLADYEDFLTRNRITYVSREVDLPSLENFLFEFKKFPQSLMQEMVGVGASIHLIYGTGVTEDPSWRLEDHQTNDNRDWSSLPGSGGAPYTFREWQNFQETTNKADQAAANYRATMRAYCQRYRNCDPGQYAEPYVERSESPVHEDPTRIVINQLYNRSQGHGSHGSNNLFLHEHGHALDSTYAFHGVSHQPAWQEIMNDETNRNFLVKIDSTYALQPIEGFAEGFAYYNNCEATRSHMEAEAPAMAEYFRNLTSIPQGQ